MKKQFTGAVLALLLLPILACSAGAIDVIVDSQPLALDVAPQVVDQRILVPLRPIFEALGATVDWDGGVNITATKGDDIVSLTIGSDLAYHNGQPTTLDAPAIAVDGRTLVPVRFVAESLSAKVYWLQDAQTVRIATRLYPVVRVVDGDTLVVSYQGAEEKVRLIGVDTPESVHPDATQNTEAGMSASAYTTAALLWNEVELEFDTQLRDQYGRMLAYVYVGGQMFNKTLLEEGYAAMTTYPPNVRYVDDFYAIVHQQFEDNYTPPPEPEPPATDSTVLPPVQPETPPASDQSTTTVTPQHSTIYVTKTGKKYHYDSSCNGGTYYSSTLEQAKARGLTPCSKCVLP